MGDAFVINSRALVPPLLSFWVDQKCIRSAEIASGTTASECISVLSQPQVSDLTYFWGLRLSTVRLFARYVSLLLLLYCLFKRLCCAAFSWPWPPLGLLVCGLALSLVRVSLVPGISDSHGLVCLCLVRPTSVGGGSWRVLPPHQSLIPRAVQQHQTGRAFS